MAIILLSGERGAGKTTALSYLANECARAGLKPGGTLQPGIFDETGFKLGSRWVDIAEGSSGELASTTSDLHGPLWKRWSFSSEGLRAANAAVIAALEAGLSPMLVDEIGPLELRLKAGLYPALTALLGAEPHFAMTPDAASLSDTGTWEDTHGTMSLVQPSPRKPHVPTLVIAVRTDLLNELDRLFPRAQHVAISPENREAALRDLCAALGLEPD